MSIPDSEREALLSAAREAAGSLPRFAEALEILAGARERRGAAPQQEPEFFYPGLAARPWHDLADAPWRRALCEAHGTILDELLALRRGGGFQPYLEMQPGGSPHVEPSQLHDSGEWNVYYFKLHGQPFAENQQRAPRVAELIEQVPRNTGMACLSALSPGTVIPPHCGVTNAQLRLHLGVVVPHDCGLEVGGIARSWVEGGLLLFDDSFSHRAWNHGAATRVVLMIDVWHPDLEPGEVDALERFQRELLGPRLQAVRAFVERTRGRPLGPTWWV